MSRLREVLTASLLVVLLFPAAVYADQTDEANRLMDQANALVAESLALDAERLELTGRLMEIDAEAKNAADAQALLVEMEASLDEMATKQESASVLWDRVAALAVDDEQRTYAAQQKEAAELAIQFCALERTILDTVKVLYGQAGTLSQRDHDKLVREFNDLVALQDELRWQYNEKMQASDAYYEENDLGKESRGWVIPVGIGSLIVAALFAFLCGFLARRKNRSTVGWAILGFLLPVIALILVAVLAEKEPEQPAAAATPSAESPPPSVPAALAESAPPPNNAALPAEIAPTPPQPPPPAG